MAKNDLSARVTQIEKRLNALEQEMSKLSKGKVGGISGNSDSKLPGSKVLQEHERVDLTQRNGVEGD